MNKKNIDKIVKLVKVQYPTATYVCIASDGNCWVENEVFAKNYGKEYKKIDLTIEDKDNK